MLQNEPKITLLIHSLRGGGAERVCLTLANGLKQKGWNVNLLVLNLKEAVLQNQLSPEITITDLKTNHARTAFFKIAKYLKQSKPSVVLVFNPQLAVVLVLIRKLFRIRFRIICRNINTLSQKKQDQKKLWHRYVVDALIRYFFHGVDDIICQSEGMKEDLIAHYAVEPNKTIVINNPLNPKIEKAVSDVDWGKIQKKDYFLCVGRLESQKAFHYAIEAFSIVAKRHPTVKLKILGQGSLEAQLKELVRKLNLSDRVDFEGFQKEMATYYLEAKATLLTSLYEGFPNVLIESMAIGTPVVAFDCPSGPREIIYDGENGFLVEYLNTNHLARTLCKVLEQEPLDPLAVHQTVQRYSSKAIIAEYESFLKKRLFTKM